MICAIIILFFSKNLTVRQTQIVPSSTWGGQGLLGVSIRFCTFDGANQNVWHILTGSIYFIILNFKF